MNPIFYTKVKLSGNSFLVLPALDVKYIYPIQSLSRIILRWRFDRYMSPVTFSDIARERRGMSVLFFALIVYSGEHQNAVLLYSLAD